MKVETHCPVCGANKTLEKNKVHKCQPCQAEIELLEKADAPKGYAEYKFSVGDMIVIVRDSFGTHPHHFWMHRHKKCHTCQCAGDTSNCEFFK